MIKNFTRRDGLTLLSHFAVAMAYPKDMIILQKEFGELMTGIRTTLPQDYVFKIKLDEKYVKNMPSYYKPGETLHECISGVLVAITVVSEPILNRSFNHYYVE